MPMEMRPRSRPILPFQDRSFCHAGVRLIAEIVPLW
jgi:hypothetical protein